MEGNKIIFESEWPTQTICPYCLSYHTSPLPIDVSCQIRCENCDSWYRATPMSGGENYMFSCDKMIEEVD
jgi:hypothetical protein